MTLTKSLSIGAIALVCALPSVSFAATTPSSVTTSVSHPTVQQLLTELAQLQAQLAALSKVSTASSTSPSSTVSPAVPMTPILGMPFTLIPSNHVDLGHIRVTLLGFEHLTSAPNTISSTSPLAGPLAKITLQYSPSTNYFAASSNYPTMTAELAAGQSTTYMGQTITLQSFAVTNVLMSITPAQ